MTRTTTPFIFIGLSLLPLGAGALGLGSIQVHSALNQPLDAEIEIVAARTGELDNLSIDLAPPRTFVQAGVERIPLLSDLQFDVVTEGGRDLVRVTTQRPVREPFLNFLVEMTGSQGRMVREFTVLLDPPDYRNPAPRRTPAPAPVPAPAAPAASVREPVVTGERVYGPVARGETLWQIADRLRPPSMTIPQMMQALYQANPQAFAGSPDSLRAGVRLQVPSLPGLPAAPVAVAPPAAPPAPPAPTVAQAGSSPPETAAEPAADEPEADEPVIGDPATRPRVRLVPPQTQERVQEEAPFGPEATPTAQEGSGVAGGQGEAPTGLPGPTGADTGPVPLPVALRIPTDNDRLTGLRLSTLADLRSQIDALGQGATRPPVSSRPPTTGTPAAESSPVLAPAPLPEQSAGQAPARPTPVAVTPAPAQPGLVEGLLRSLEGLLLPLGALLLGAGLLLALLVVRRRRARSELPEVEEDQGFTVLESAAPPPRPGKIVQADAPPPAPTPGPVMPLVPPRPRPAVAPASTETPLERADLLIAVGNYAEAENLVRSALDRQPDSAALGAKLLDIHYAAGNLEAFREEAGRLRRQLDDTDDPLWHHVETMGQDLLPDDPLFGGPPAPAPGPLPPLTKTPQEDRWILDWEPDKPAAAHREMPAPPPPPIPAPPPPREAFHPSPFSADETFIRLDPEEDVPLPTPREVTEDEDFFKEVFEDLEWQEDHKPQPAAPSELPDLEFDLESLPDLSTPTQPVEPAEPAPPAGGDNPFAADDYVETKLDLAVAYLDMEDPVGARSLLEEVVHEGSDHQRRRARELMGRLSG